jgi:hypothetical protein
MKSISAVEIANANVVANCGHVNQVRCIMRNNSNESLLKPRKRLNGADYLDYQGFTALLE